MNDESTDAAQNQPQAGRQVQFAIGKIYLKDMSFEAPNSPAALTQEMNPKVELQFSNSSNSLGNNQHEVVLTATVTVTNEATTVYLAEVQQAGIFHIDGVPDENLPAILATACPNTLLPFAREAISDIVAKGGFPQMLITPVNFELLYMQEMQKRRQQQQPSSEPPASDVTH